MLPGRIQLTKMTPVMMGMTPIDWCGSQAYAEGPW